MITIKATGIVRKIDDLGRLVIPTELRKTMNIKKQDSMEIFVEGNNIILTKYIAGCIFCGEVSNTFQYADNTICYSCFENIREAIKEE